MIVDRFVSSDARATNIQVELLIPSDEAPLLKQFDIKLRELIQSMESDDRIVVAGRAALAVQISNTVEQDNKIFFPLVIVVIGTVLFLSFLKLQAIFIPLLITNC